MTHQNQMLNQANFIIGSVMEFLKIWESNQEATFRVDCKNGEASINFNAKFQKQKSLSPSKRRRNERRAAAFHERFNSETGQSSDVVQKNLLMIHDIKLDEDNRRDTENESGNYNEDQNDMNDKSSDNSDLTDQTVENSIESVDRDYRVDNKVSDNSVENNDDQMPI